jgi:hypothetical protein
MQELIGLLVKIILCRWQLHTKTIQLWVSQHFHQTAQIHI